MSSKVPPLNGRSYLLVRVSIRGLEVSAASVKQVFGQPDKESAVIVRNHLPSKAVKTLKYGDLIQPDVPSLSGIRHAATFYIDATGAVVESKFVMEGYEK
jgi:hypothetical protein